MFIILDISGTHVRSKNVLKVVNLTDNLHQLPTLLGEACTAGERGLVGVGTSSTEESGLK